MKVMSYSGSRAKYAETAYLLRSPENARRLVTAIERPESDGGARHGLVE
ncbi:hypothetical protein NI17_016435 [Thermobifida halotolerans]|uniref:Antitoxin YefM n=1 Tax=Thermobifida halotolerans TaxID=483545 RepID=A0AA97LUN5_9ACTN|nr:hypothetical protein [Thermobifida halotolerans]UOE18402.1 hypothetical protein NI17_016435 [Thermobifida halotolerans]